MHNLTAVFMVSLLFSAYANDAVEMRAKQAELLRDVPDTASPFDWWEPDCSRRDANAAFEKANGMAVGGTVRLLEQTFLDELAKPDGGDTGTVSRALKALVQSGDSSVTNALGKALFAEVNPHRGLTLSAYVGVAAWEARSLAERVVRELPVGERLACYSEVASRMGKLVV